MWNNADKFDHLISLAATKCTEEEAKKLNELDTSGVEFDEAYYRKRNKAIKKYKRGPKGFVAKVIVIRFAAAVVIIAAMLAVLVSCVPGLRQAIYDAVTVWCEDYFAIRYESEDGEEKETDENEENEVPTYIKEFHKPTNLPDDVWEDVILQGNTKLCIDYYVNEECLFSFTQFILDPNYKYIDNEDMIVTSIKFNENVATVIEYQTKPEKCIVWNDGKYAYQILSNTLGIVELIEYAKNVE